MDIKEYMKELVSAPYTRMDREYIGFSKDITYYLRDEFQYKQAFNSIYGDINCYLREDRHGPSGCVSLDIEIDNLQQGEPIHFKDLLVPSRIENNGVGTYLMLTVIDYVRVAKEVYEVTKAVPVRGWLSPADAENGNWRDSLPLYDRVGNILGVEHFFEASDEMFSRYNNPADFYSHAGKNGGAIVYLV